MILSGRIPQTSITTLAVFGLEAVPISAECTDSLEEIL